MDYFHNNTMYFSSNSYGVDKTYALQYTAYLQQQKNKQLLQDFKQYLKEITYASKAYAQLLESLQLEKTELSKKKIALMQQMVASSKELEDSIAVVNATKPQELVVNAIEKKVEQKHIATADNKDNLNQNLSLIRKKKMQT